jgi:hypothetical protein
MSIKIPCRKSGSWLIRKKTIIILPLYFIIQGKANGIFYPIILGKRFVFMRGRANRKVTVFTAHAIGEATAQKPGRPPIIA